MRCSHPKPRRLFSAAVLGWLGWMSAMAISGCHREASRKAPQPERHFVRGQVVAVDPAKGTVTLAHEAIAGLMPAMMMEYKVADPAALGELHPGDRIAADLLDDAGPNGPTNLRLASVDILAQAKADYRPAMQYHVPAVGEAVPDFALRNQSGKLLHLGDFKGKVLLLTFVYTRCPLSDYCPRMSRNFASIDQQLQTDPKLYARTHLLTISFDPAYDTPAVLRSYGGAYTGRYANETFQHWDFAAPSEVELPKLEQWFDVGVTPASKQLQHSLATVIVGKDGKVRAFYPTNDWTVSDALAVTRAAAAS